MEISKPKRKWFRFSLRALFVLTAVVAVFVGWSVHRLRVQRSAVAAIQQAGGTIMYNFHENSPRTWTTANQPHGPQWLRKLLGPEFFDKPSKVSFREVSDEDQWIDALNDLATVKTLIVSGSNVTDTTLARIKGSAELVELHLNATAVTDDGLQQLEKFPNLQWLSLWRARISKDAVATLKVKLPKVSVSRS